MTRPAWREWLFVFAGPLAWFAAHVASWMIAPGAHESGRVRGLVVVDLIALAIAFGALVIAAIRVRALVGQPADDRQAQRARFMAGGGLALSALSIVLLVGLVLPVVLLAPGAEP